jgi:hypothetical protein
VPLPNAVCDYDVAEARNLLRDYRAVLPRCRNGELLKEELAKLNLRVFALGIILDPDSLLSDKFHHTVAITSERFEQGGLYAHMRETQNIEKWIEFLTELSNPSPEVLAAVACRTHPLL